MARRRRPSKTSKAGRLRQRQMRLAMGLVGAVLALVVCALTLTVPGFTGWVFRLAGVTRITRPPPTGADSPVALHVIDVGAGDAALLEDNGEFALWDGGPPEGADALVAYLEGAGVERLRYIFLTHPHADHYGGLEAVIERFDVEHIILPDLNLAPYPTARAFERLLLALDERRVDTAVAKLGDSLPLGQGVIEVLHTGLAADDNYNMLSLGLRYAGTGLTVLATGDCEKPNERAMLEAGANVAARVFLAGHHGSSTSNSPDFVNAVAPELVVVSCAAGNGYGHPHNSALRAYEGVGARVLRTDKDGSVVVQPSADGRLAVGVENQRDTAA